MRKTTLILIAAVILILAAILPMACTSSAPTQPAKEQESAKEQVASTEPVKLLFATYSAEKGFVSAGLRAFGEDLVKRTNGQVTVEYSYSMALGKISEYYDILVNGVADVVHYSPYQTPGMFPLSEVGTLPFVVPSAEIGSKAFDMVYKQGILDKRFYEGTKTLFVCGDGGSNLRTTNRPVRTLADAKGLKIMIPGGEIMSARVTAMGAVPVVVTGPDVYVALQRGTVEGQLTGWAPMIQFKWCEVNNYATEPLIGGSPWAIGMNLDSYNRLPENVKKVIDEMVANDMEYIMATAADLDRMNKASRDCFLQMGKEIVQWEPAALEELGENMKPIWEKWISDNEAKGLPAREVLDAYYYALKSLGVEKPAVGYTPQR